jgi:hypothetical protein
LEIAGTADLSAQALRGLAHDFALAAAVCSGGAFGRHAPPPSCGRARHRRRVPPSTRVGR